MTYSVSVSPEVYAILQVRASQSQVSPDVLADDALRMYFIEGEPTWRRAFDALVERVQARSSSFKSEEIEADITAAAEEVKELRRDRRRSG